MRLQFVKTCSACPEQYDVYDRDTEKQVAYIRVRHGYCRCDVPTSGGLTLYGSSIRGDGCFDSEKERSIHISRIVEAIDRYYQAHPLSEGEGVVEEINNVQAKREEELRVQCPKCNNSMNPTYRFCPHCGSKVEEKICSRCNKRYISNQRIDTRHSVLVEKSIQNTECLVSIL